mgnify:CR=1 FL=1
MLFNLTLVLLLKSSLGLVFTLSFLGLYSSNNKGWLSVSDLPTTSTVYKSLLEEHSNLAKKLEEIKDKEKLEEKKQTEFSDKIDELNQETDTLLEEIDKWQM